MTAAAALPPAVRERRPLLLVLAAHGISMAGDTMTFVAVPWFVLQTTGSATRTGIAAAAAILPVVVASVLGGTLVDRLGYRRTSVTADLASGATVALIPLLHLAGLLRFPVLLALVFLGGLLDAPAKTSRIALLPDLARRAGTTLERSSSSLDAVERTARALGAPLAGLLIALLGPTTVLFVDAATFGVSALLMRASGVDAAPADTERGNYLAAVRTGLGFVVRDPLLRAIVVMVTLTNMLDFAYFGVLLPLYADRVLDSSTSLGFLLGATTAGAALGAVAFGAVGHRLPRRAAYAVAFFVVGSPRFFALAAGLPVPALVTISVLGGVCAGVINPILGVAEVERTPPHLRARVLGALTAGAMAASPLGPLLGSALVGAFGLPATLRIVGTGYLLLTLLPFVLPAWRLLDRRPAAAEVEAV